jgi:hypothetical protein
MIHRQAMFGHEFLDSRKLKENRRYPDAGYEQVGFEMAFPDSSGRLDFIGHPTKS